MKLLTFTLGNLMLVDSVCSSCFSLS